MQALILAACLAQSPVFEGDPTLAESLRDAQVTNRAAFRTGRISGRIANKFLDGRTVIPMRVEFETWWDGPKTFWKLKFRDKGQRFTSRGSEYDYSQEPDWEYILRTEDRCYIYNAVPRMVAVNDGAKYDTSEIEVNPWDSWFYCRPPYGKKGTLWRDQIGSVAEPGGTRSHFLVERQGADLIRQARKDPNGGVNATIFSMAACGNVVSTSYDAADRSSSSSKGTYDWRKLEDGLCVLDGWKFSSTRSTGGNLDAEFEMNVDSIDVKTPVDPARFTLDFLLRQLPANIVLQDNITSTYKRVNVASVPLDITKSLEALAAPLRVRRFLNPDR